MLSTESSPRRKLGTSTRELHGASLCLIVASFSMSHYRVSRAALSHAPSENQRVTGAGLRSRLGDRVAVDGGILRLARVQFSCAWTKLLARSRKGHRSPRVARPLKQTALLAKPMNGINAPKRPDCVAGHEGLELRNVAANYPFERAHRFAGIQPNSGDRDYSRLSCAAGTGAAHVPVGDSATLVRDRRLGVRWISRILLDAVDEIERGVKRLVVLRIWRDIGL